MTQHGEEDLYAHIARLVQKNHALKEQVVKHQIIAEKWETGCRFLSSELSESNEKIMEMVKTARRDKE